MLQEKELEKHFQKKKKGKKQTGPTGPCSPSRNLLLKPISISDQTNHSPAVFSRQAREERARVVLANNSPAFSPLQDPQPDESPSKP
jgi:hypothetical protein